MKRTLQQPSSANGHLGVPMPALFRDMYISSLAILTASSGVAAITAQEIVIAPLDPTTLMAAFPEASPHLFSTAIVCARRMRLRL
jgi:hypothetical protein